MIDSIHSSLSLWIREVEIYLHVTVWVHNGFVLMFVQFCTNFPLFPSVHLLYVWKPTRKGIACGKIKWSRITFMQNWDASRLTTYWLPVKYYKILIFHDKQMPGVVGAYFNCILRSSDRKGRNGGSSFHSLARVSIPKHLGTDILPSICLPSSSI